MLYPHCENLDKLIIFDSISRIDPGIYLKLLDDRQQTDLTSYNVVPHVHSVSRVRGASGREEVKADHEGEGSAASVPNSEKCLSEAAARSAFCPERLARLKMGDILRQNPGFEYL
ncbi:hypothetical protein [Nostoc sp.]|uniref:hypothetical protein n=1 Tax=Nostoc sp. TaxID=1180 RepID=UPI002FFC2B4A